MGFQKKLSGGNRGYLLVKNVIMERTVGRGQTIELVGANNAAGRGRQSPLSTCTTVRAPPFHEAVAARAGRFWRKGNISSIGFVRYDVIIVYWLIGLQEAGGKCAMPDLTTMVDRNPLCHCVCDPCVERAQPVCHRRG